MALTDLQAKQRIWAFGHYWCPENNGLAPVVYGALDAVPMNDERTINAFRSFSVSMATDYVPNALIAHGRAPDFDGIVGPAMEATLEVERCAVPDFAPPAGMLFVGNQGVPDDVYESLRPGEAVGDGNWKRCHDVGDFHSASVRVNRSGIGSHLQPVFEEVLKNVQASYAGIGLLFRFIENGKDMLTGETWDGQINIEFSFVQRSSGWIGLAIIGQNQGCSSNIWCQYLASYRPSNVVNLWTTLVKHELGHNTGKQHTSGGVMNPSILGGLPTMWPSNDPSTAWMKSRFGGQPVGVDDPGPKPDPPDSIEERIRALELTDIVHGETLKYLLRGK